MNPQFALFRKQITNPFRFRLFMLSGLPLAFFSGIKIEHLSEQQAVVSVKQKWFNKNPFHSVYFAVLVMAAEISTGILCMGAIYKRRPAVSMLVVKNESLFHKKAVGKITFTCNDGEAINKTIEDVINKNESNTITCCSIAKNELEETIAEFYFTWSFKAKNK